MNKIGVFSIFLVLLLCSLSLEGTSRASQETYSNEDLDPYRKKAKSGDLDSIYILVEKLTDGAPRYNSEAEHWLRVAAKKDNNSVKMLAEMLLMRKDRQGFEEALDLLRPMAHAKDPLINKRIGNAYMNRNMKQESVGWLQSAAIAGDYDSAVLLSNMYFEEDNESYRKLSLFWACHAISIRNDDSFMTGKMRDRKNFIENETGGKCP